VPQSHLPLRKGGVVDSFAREKARRSPKFEITGGKGGLGEKTTSVPHKERKVVYESYARTKKKGRVERHPTSPNELKKRDERDKNPSVEEEKSGSWEVFSDQGRRIWFF